MVRILIKIWLITVLLVSCKQDNQVAVYLHAINRTDKILVLQKIGDSWVLHKTITDSTSLLSFRDIFSTGLHKKEQRACAGNTQLVLYKGAEQLMRISFCDDASAMGIKDTGAGFSLTFGMTYRMGMFPNGP